MAEEKPRAATCDGASALFLLQEPRRFLAQYWKKAFRCLRQEPRQRHFDAQRVLQHLNARRRSLAEREHAEAQCISLPSLLLHRDHPSKVTVGAGEALLETANGLDLPETMANYDCDGIAHRNCNCVGWTCMPSIMIEWRIVGVSERTYTVSSSNAPSIDGAPAILQRPHSFTLKTATGLTDHG